MLDLGVVRPGSTIRIPVNTFAAAGQSITATNFLAADILIYKDGSTTERGSTSGYTVTVDFDAKTGRHILEINLADNTTAGFYSAGSEYLVAIDSITVDALTVGAFVGRFRIGQRAAIYDTTIATLSSQTSFTLTAGPAEDDALNGMWCIIHDVASAVQMSWALVSDYTGSTRTVTLAAAPTFTAAASDNISIMFPAPLQPTVLGRTLDVSAGGEAGLDWANVGSPTTTVGLSGTTISTTQAVASVSGNVGGNVTGSVGSVASGGITSASFATGAITNTAIASSAIGSAELDATALSAIADAVWDEVLSGHLTSGTTGAGLNAAGSAGDPWSTALPGAYGAGSAGYILGTNLNATVSSRASQTSLDTLDDYVDTEVAAIKAKTDLIPSDPADASDIAALIDALPTAAETATAVLTTQMTESYAADGTAPTLAQAVFLVQQSLHEFSISGTTRTVKRLDGSTTAATFTLDSSTAPTSTTRAS